MHNTCIDLIYKMKDRELTNYYYIFENLTKKPQNFLSYQENITDTVRGLVKNLYDITKHSENNTARSTALPELIVDRFDEEQIWQELELQNNDWNNIFMSNVLKFIVNKDNILFPININGSKDKDAVISKMNNGKLKETENTDVSRNFKNTNTVDFDGDDDIDIDDYDDDDDMDSIGSDLKPVVIGDLNQTNKKLKVKNQERQTFSVVDDRFFKLSEMERFLEVEEQRDQKDSSESNLHDSDSDIDYFADELQDEGYGIEKQKAEARYKYEDFFAPVEDLYENEAGQQKIKQQLDVYNTESQVREHVSNVDSTDDFKDVSTKETKSSFEERQERLQNKIKRLEEEVLQEKPWQLSGEIDGSARPQNSLLEEFVDFDIMTRPAPVITEETTIRLEDVIIRRIKDKSWDDVERKIKPVETTELFKKPFVLNQEKSKLSLAEVYEQDYLKQKDLVVKTQDEYNEIKDTEPQLHTEVRAMMTSLFNKLDALSSFHCTPRPVVPELKVVSNIPAVNMEEVAPVAASNSMLLAPEEVQGNSFKKLINKGEQTVTDKKRTLRNKKKKQRKRAKEMMKKNARIIEKQTTNHGYKSKKQKLENKINSCFSSTTQSSKKFFSSLQEVNSNIKRKVKSFNQSKK